MITLWNNYDIVLSENSFAIIGESELCSAYCDDNQQAAIMSCKTLKLKKNQCKPRASILMLFITNHLWRQEGDTVEWEGNVGGKEVNQVGNVHE